MATDADEEMLASKMSDPGEDPEERRRILNVLAQRRYRRRKQERLKVLERQLQKRGSNDRGTSGPTSTEILSTIVLSQGEPSDMANAGQPIVASAEESTIGFPLADTQPTPSVPYLYSYDASTNFDNLIPTTTPTTSLEDFAFTLSDMSTTAFLQPDTVQDFADYAITTPGLSVIRAHTEIVRHMHGPNYQLDIWDPSALSPFCSGPANVMSSDIPRHYQPTPLQVSIKHHPVVDMIPWPSFRDRLLYVMTLPTELRPRIAQGDMASVTFELMLAIKDAGGGLRVWNKNPFLAENWEIGQEFYSKFWWAIDGEVVKQSNHIRTLRGENILRTDRFNIT